MQAGRDAEPDLRRAEAVLRLRAVVQDGSYARLWERRLKPAA